MYIYIGVYIVKILPNVEMVYDIYGTKYIYYEISHIL